MRQTDAMCSVELAFNEVWALHKAVTGLNSQPTKVQTGTTNTEWQLGNAYSHTYLHPPTYAPAQSHQTLSEQQLLGTSRDT